MAFQGAPPVLFSSLTFTLWPGLTSFLFCLATVQYCQRLESSPERLFLGFYILCANFNLIVSPYLFYTFKLFLPMTQNPK